MRTFVVITLAIFYLTPVTAFAVSDTELANAADHCNSSAYNTLKPQRSKEGARELMTVSANGKKFAKWMKKYIKLINTCQAESYLPDCKPQSKIDNYHVKLKESKAKLQENMVQNYLCSLPLVNKFAAENTSAAQISDLLEAKVNESLGVAAAR